jgi:putative component of membrane protein insertase Oxa1/YidC/SpoIIIJ protein YidD
MILFRLSTFAFGMRRLALALIRFYQRQLSPRKGFSCAYRIHTGGASCSGYGVRVIGRFGTVVGLALLNRRLKRCSEQHRLHPPRRPVPGLLRSQRGVVDCNVDLPDVTDCACDLLDLTDCNCAWDCGSWSPIRRWRDRRQRRNGTIDYIPPP